MDYYNIQIHKQTDAEDIEKDYYSILAKLNTIIL